MNKEFSDNAWNDYLYWQKNDKANVKKINNLLKSIEREGFSEGIGKPEPLKHDLSGFWSRRITNEHRLVYTVEGNTIKIASCKDHY